MRESSTLAVSAHNDLGVGASTSCLVDETGQDGSVFGIAAAREGVGKDRGAVIDALGGHARFTVVQLQRIREQGADISLGRVSCVFCERCKLTYHVARLSGTSSKEKDDVSASSSLELIRSRARDSLTKGRSNSRSSDNKKVEKLHDEVQVMDIFGLTPFITKKFTYRGITGRLKYLREFRAFLFFFFFLLFHFSLL